MSRTRRHSAPARLDYEQISAYNQGHASPPRCPAANRRRDPCRSRTASTEGRRRNARVRNRSTLAGRLGCEAVDRLWHALSRAVPAGGHGPPRQPLGRSAARRSRRTPGTAAVCVDRRGCSGCHRRCHVTHARHRATTPAGAGMNVATAVVRAWTAIYTAGLAPGVRDARRREIASDLWESTHGDGPRPGAAGLLMRLLLGVPDDLIWRRGQPRRHRPVRIVLVTVSAAVLLVMVWLMGRATALPLPPPLPDQIGWHARFDRPPGPPPPPPPPPCPPAGSGHTAADGCSPR